MESSHIDPMVYRHIMQQTRRRRAYFFATVLGYIPALLIVHRISPTNRAMGTLFAVWLGILILCTILVCMCKCPRCGNYFHVNGITLLVLRKCLHCQLHISANEPPQ